MKLKRVHRVLQFHQSRWMKQYIDFNTEKRRRATTDFERDFSKSLNNSVFGKTMENLRNRVNVSLCNDEIKAKNIVASPTFKHAEIINENLVMIRDGRILIFCRIPDSDIRRLKSGRIRI